MVAKTEIVQGGGRRQRKAPDAVQAAAAAMAQGGEGGEQPGNVAAANPGQQEGPKEGTVLTAQAFEMVKAVRSGYGAATELAKAIHDGTVDGQAVYAAIVQDAKDAGEKLAESKVYGALRTAWSRMETGLKLEMVPEKTMIQCRDYTEAEEEARSKAKAKAAQRKAIVQQVKALQDEKQTPTPAAVVAAIEHATPDARTERVKAISAEFAQTVAASALNEGAAYVAELIKALDAVGYKLEFAGQHAPEEQRKAA